jgi:serine/threonine-protein kinase PpkA
MTLADVSPVARKRQIRSSSVGRTRSSVRAARALPRIPGYKLERRVGQGRMSTAYLARDLRRDADVVLKILNAGHAGDPVRHASFAQEFAIPLLISNKHVIRVFDQSVAGEFSYIAMEYLDGGDLCGWIRRGLAAREALSLLRQAAVAASQLHHGGFVHCDIKPGNLLLRSCGDLVLADFGLACRVGATSVAPQGTVIGTPRYAAPEQTEGAAAQPASDVYSLGVVLYEMLCGTPPFTGPTAMELQCQHLMAAVPRLPPELARFQPLVDGMLEKEVHRRLPNGPAVLHQIDLIKNPDVPENSASGAIANRC